MRDEIDQDAAYAAVPCLDIRPVRISHGRAVSGDDGFARPFLQLEPQQSGVMRGQGAVMGAGVDKAEKTDLFFSAGIGDIDKQPGTRGILRTDFRERNVF